MEVTLAVVEGPHQGRSFTFREHDGFIVGRGQRAHFRLPIRDKYFSRHHFLVEVNPPRCRLLDLGSTNGTKVNSRKVRSADLKDGDLIKGGITTIRVTFSDLNSVSSSVMSPGDPGQARPDELAARPPGPTPGAESEPAPPPRRRPDPVHAESPKEPSLASDQSTWPPDGAKSASSHCMACGRVVPRPVTGSDLPICSECRDEMRRRDQPIAGYKIIRELGQGGMGIVYLALRERAGDLVALKMIVPEVAVAARKEDVERFVREASIVRGLDHPNIVAFRDAGESAGRIYFAMEYVSGIDAARLLRENGGPLAIPRAVDLVGQLLEALEYAHARKFVHRDIKPGNLLVAREGGRDRALLADFGLARAYQASRLSGLTMTDDLRGTPAFMAPEQITNFREAKPATDLYSAGATLYNLLTDRHILDFPKRQELKLLMILENDPVPIRSRRPEVSEALAAVIHRALAKDPADRFRDAKAMRAALAASLRKH